MLCDLVALCAGTGKSSIVCAMCLGLGGRTNLLGRAKEVCVQGCDWGTHVLGLCARYMIEHLNCTPHVV